MGRDEGQGREQRRRATKDGASTDVPIVPRDASDGRVSGLVFCLLGRPNNKLAFNASYAHSDTRTILEAR